MRVSGEDDSPDGADERAFDDFSTATASWTVRVLHAMTGDLAEAQDVVQEAYARAWQRWAALEGGAAVRAVADLVADRLRGGG